MPGGFVVIETWIQSRNVHDAPLDLRGQRCHAQCILRVRGRAVRASGPRRWYGGIIGLGGGDEDVGDAQSGAAPERAASLLKGWTREVAIRKQGFAGGSAHDRGPAAPRSRPRAA